MDIPFLDLKRQYSSIKNEIDYQLDSVISNQKFIFGEKLIEFENKFAKYLGVKHVVGLGSGTDAIKFAVEALSIKGTAITVSNTFISTVNGLVNNNLKPIFADIDEKTFNLNIKTAKKENDTSAVLPVHLYGQSANMLDIMNYAKENNLIVIEDASQSHGAEFNGKKVGTFGEAGCFSFYPTKNLGSYGDAGAIATNDETLAEKIRMMRNYGSPKKYYHNFIGYNSRMDELQAAILLAKLKHLDHWNYMRRMAAKRYDNKLKSIPEVKIPEEINGKHIYYTYVLRCANRNSLQMFLSEKGVSTLVHYPIPVHKQKAYAEYNNIFLPVTDRVSQEILSLPMFPEIRKEEIDYVCGKINEFYS